jgi:energy-coupling factor transport system permease protein
LTVAPQLVESAQRVYRARRLRGETGRRTRLFREVVIPVMTDALDRSLMLAAAMDSRGYGRTGSAPRGSRRLTGMLVLAGLVGICIGTYGLLDSTTPRTLGVPMRVVGLAAATAGFALGGRRVGRTRYRPDPWRLPEWGVSACGVAVATAVIVLGRLDPSALNPPLQPLQWPPLPLAAVVALLIGLLPAWIAPPVRSGAAA